MATSSRDLITWENGKYKRRPSSLESMEFLSIAIGASKLEIKESTGAFDFSNHVLSNISNAVVDTDVAGWGQIKAYVGAQVVSGGTVKQALLTEIQLDDTEGILPGLVAFLTTQAVEDDTVVLKDAAGNTETYTFKAAKSAPFEVTIGGTVAVTMSNLSAEINLSSIYWKAWYDTTVLDSIYTTGLVGIYRKVVAQSAFKIWVTGTVAGSVTDYHTSLEYKTNTSVLVALGNTEPATALSGFSIAKSALTNGEIHLVIAEDKLKEWNGDANNGLGTWFTLSEGVIPVASSGSGGAVLGKTTYDSDKGVEVTGIGIVKAKIDNSSIYFDGSGNIAVKADGITKTHINVDVAGTGLQQNLDGSLEVKADITGGANLAKAINVHANGVAVKVDDSTIEGDATSGQLKVKALGITASQLAANSVTAAKLNSDVAGSGLVLNGTSNAIDVNVGNGIEISTDTVAVKANITGGANLAKAIDVSTDGVAVKVDASTIEGDGTSGQLKVKAAGITETQIASSSLVTGGSLKGGSGTKLDVDYAKSLTNDNAGTITIRQVVYGKSNGNVDLAVATNASLDAAELAIVEDATIATTVAGKCVVKRGAIIGGFSGLTPGKKQYVDRSTAGAMVESLATWVAGNMVYSVGRALSATELIFDPQFEFEY